MPSINIHSIDLRVAGISAETVGGALRVLPVTLSQHISELRTRGDATYANNERPLRLEPDASEEDVAHAVAARIAVAVAAGLPHTGRQR